MSERTSTVDVDAPIDHVFAVLTDIPAWREWMPRVKESRLKEGLAEGGVGAVYVVDEGWGPTDVTVTRLDPPHEFAIESTQAGASYTFTYHCTTLPSGRTRAVGAIGSGNLLGGAMNGLFGGTFGDLLEREMLALKSRSEAGIQDR